MKASVERHPLFGELLKRAEKLGIRYEFREGCIEPYTVTEIRTGRVWTRTGSIRGLLENMVERRESGRSLTEND